MAAATDGKFRVDGKIALVTGGAGGIGGAIVRELAAAGAKVVIADTNLAAAERLAAEIGDGAVAIAVDLLDEASIAHLFSEIRLRFEGIDIFVASAGRSDTGDIFSLTPAEWHEIIGVNLTATFLCAKHAAGMMRERGAGRMIFIGSPTGHRGALRGHAAYSASKGGLFSLAKTLARTLAPHKVTVNLVSPGQTDTELLWKTNPREAIEKILVDVPLGLAKPSDVAAGVLFLASPAGGHITGTSLDIDGGGVMR
jgi:NAD(P)-dependent dehydrogenase (short-subunit alcohol dehydrogenase family)